MEIESACPADGSRTTPLPQPITRRQQVVTHNQLAALNFKLRDLSAEFGRRTGSDRAVVARFDRSPLLCAQSNMRATGRSLAVFPLRPTKYSKREAILGVLSSHLRDTPSSRNSLANLCVITSGPFPYRSSWSTNLLSFIDRSSVGFRSASIGEVCTVGRQKFLRTAIETSPRRGSH